MRSLRIQLGRLSHLARLPRHGLVGLLGLACAGCWGRAPQSGPSTSTENNTGSSSGLVTSASSSALSTSSATGTTTDSAPEPGPQAPVGYPAIERCTALPADLVPGQRGMVLVTSTDGATGAVGWIDPRTKQVFPDLALADKDTRLRHDHRYNYVINRFTADSITVLAKDPSLTRQGSFSVTEPDVPSSNPHDLIVDAKGHLHLSFLGRDHIKVYDISDPNAATLLRSIDLRPFADADGLPEASSIIHCQDTYFVLVQRLNQDQGWVPVDHSYLVPVHAPSGSLYDFDNKNGSQPDGIQILRTGMSAWRPDPKVPEGTSILALNRGLQRINLKTAQVQDLIPEQVFIDQGMDVWDVRNFAISADGRWVWILAIDNWPKHSIFRASLDQGGRDLLPIITDIESTSGAMIRVDNALWVADTTDGQAGVRIFDILQDQLVEAPDSPLAVGLAPSWLHLVP